MNTQKDTKPLTGKRKKKKRKFQEYHSYSSKDAKNAYALENRVDFDWGKIKTER